MSDFLTHWEHSDPAHRKLVDEERARVAQEENMAANGIHTLTALAECWLRSRRSLVSEFSGSTTEDLRELRQQVREQINPLLVAHGAAPLDVDRFFEFDRLDEDED